MHQQCQTQLRISNANPNNSNKFAHAHKGRRKHIPLAHKTNSYIKRKFKEHKQTHPCTPGASRMCNPRASRGIAAPRAVRGCAVRRHRSICGRLAEFTCDTSSCPLVMSDCGRRVGIDEDLRALALASTLVYCAILAATITEFVVSYIFHLASYTSYIPVSPHEEVRMTARARHFGSLPMVEVRVPLLNGAFRNDDASGHMCVYVCMFLCLCLCVGV